MLTDIQSSDPVRRRMFSLACENLRLWLFIAQNDLFDEADDFLSDDTYDKIFTRCLVIPLEKHVNNLPWDDSDDF